MTELLFYDRCCWTESSGWTARGHGASQGPETREAEEAEGPEGGAEARGDGARAPARPRGLRLLPLLLFPQGAGLRGGQCPGAGTEEAEYKK